MKGKIFILFIASITFGIVGLANVDAEASTPEYCFGFDDGVITSYSNISNNCGYEVNIPTSINGETVTEIGPGAFMNSILEKVKIPDTVTTIGNLAFYDNYLENIVIPESVNTIGYGAFNYNLANEYIFDPQDPTRLVSVAKSPYYDAESKIYVELPNTTKIIGSKAFYGMKIESITIPTSVTTIEPDAFTGANIKKLIIPSTITSGNLNVDPDQIENVKNVKYYAWSESKIFNKDAEEYVYNLGDAKTLYFHYWEAPESIYLDARSLGTNKIELNWLYVGNADYTQIYKYNPKTKTYQYYTYTYNSSSITLSKNLIAGQTYWYKVRHVLKTPDGLKHYSELSNRIGVTPRPNAPTGLKAVKYKSKTAKLSWNKVTGADGYIVYKYNINTGKLSYIKSTKNLSTTTSYKNIAGKKYYYTIKAYKVVNGKKVYSTSSYKKSVIV